MTYVTNFLFSCFNKLRCCTTDEEHPSNKAGVVFLNEVNDWFRGFETVVSMDKLCVCVCVCVCVCLENNVVRVGRSLVSRPWSTKT